MRESYGQSRVTAQTIDVDGVVEKRFATTGTATHRSALVWAEHCTECAMPACYTNCELYTPRQDLHCRRFYSDITEIGPSGGGASWLSVHFRKWGRLQAHGVPSLYSLRRVAWVEALDRIVGYAMRGVWMQHGFRMRLQSLWTRLKGHLFHVARSADIQKATHFVCETLNPGSQTIGVILTIRQEDEPQHYLQHRLELVPGYNLDRISLGSFFDSSPSGASFFVSLELEGDQYGAKLDFGHLDFVMDERGAALASAEQDKQGPKKAKCVIWDLDNTLWDGILVEQGVDGLKPRTQIFEVIRELDRRGIINSIASKNHPEAAEEALRHFGMWEYFVFPQISWGPKSEAVRLIQRSMNVGINTFLFVDDQPFERSEVETVHPEVAVLTDQEGAQLLEHERCDVVVTDESGKRRHFYQQQALREQAASDSGAEYDNFLRSCQIVIDVEPLDLPLLDRAHELVQRTNQMNFSGRRYSKAQLQELAEDPDKQCFIIRCTDRFGDYGIIGLGIVDIASWCLEDLMFSCRIQSKQVEHHFIAYLANLAKEAGAEQLKARYRKTEKNSPSGKVFDDLGFSIRGRTEDVRHLELGLADFEFGEPLLEVHGIEPERKTSGEHA